MISVGTRTIGGLEINTTSTTAGTDDLTLRFTSSTANTLTVAYLAIDATNGKVIFSVTDSATLKTDTTD